jgi:polysaccharide pyruvyl transferase WcaK-like protein
MTSTVAEERTDRRGSLSPSEPARTAPAIVLIGNHGRGNLGDEATLAATAQQLRRFLPDARLLVGSYAPTDTESRHGVMAFPITRAAVHTRLRVASERRGRRDSARARVARVLRSSAGTRIARRALRALAAPLAVLQDPFFELRSWWRLRGARLLVINGSGQLSDHFGGARGLPLVAFKWALLARLGGARVAVLAVGAGPLRSPISRALVRGLLRLADHRSLRDDPSRRLIASLGAPGELGVCPDLAFGLELPSDCRGPDPACRTVAVNVFPYRDGRYWPASDPERYRAYLERTASFVRWLLEGGRRVIVLPTQLIADERVLDDLEVLLRDSLTGEPPSALERPRVGTLRELLDELERADVVVATRFHAIVLGFLLGRPVLGLANESKMEEAMSWLGQREYCLPLDGLELERVEARFEALCANAAAVAEEVRERAAESRRRVEEEVAILAAGLRDQGAGRR